MISIEVDKYLDEDTREAILSIVSGTVHLVVFSFPYNGKHLADTMTLYALFATDLCREEYAAPVKIEGNFFGYHIVGEVVSIKPPIVSIEDIHIVLDAKIPGDIQTGEMLGFNVSRLDY